MSKVPLNEISIAINEDIKYTPEFKLEQDSSDIYSNFDKKWTGHLPFPKLKAIFLIDII